MRFISRGRNNCFAKPYRSGLPLPDRPKSLSAVYFPGPGQLLCKTVSFRAPTPGPVRCATPGPAKIPKCGLFPGAGESEIENRIVQGSHSRSRTRHIRTYQTHAHTYISDACICTFACLLLLADIATGKPAFGGQKTIDLTS